MLSLGFSALNVTSEELKDPNLCLFQEFTYLRKLGTSKVRKATFALEEGAGVTEQQPCSQPITEAEGQRGQESPWRKAYDQPFLSSHMLQMSTKPSFAYMKSEVQLLRHACFWLVFFT